MRKLKSRGQALVLFLGFAAAMVGMMLIVFNSGQVTNAKMRAMNAADAAAYSGALWQARSLNFQAYMNRAMVVNEVAIAQSVSLRSWVAYVDRFATNINAFTVVIPYVGAATTALQRSTGVLNRTVQASLPPVEIALRFTNRAEHVAQGVFNSTGSTIAQDLANNVARSNGAVMSVGNYALMLLNSEKWLTFTKGYENNQRTRIRDVVLNSRDGFSRTRDSSLSDPTGVIFEIRKQGGTDLIDYDSWKALDSSELRMFKILGKWRTKTPLAWAGAQGWSPRSRSQIGRHGDNNEWSTSDGVLARADANLASSSKNIRVPLQGYRDIADPLRKNANLQVPFSVEVAIESRKIASANRAFNAQTGLINGTRLEHDPNYAAGKGVFALAESCVRFGRPYRHDRVDQAREFPSLYNPYWTASLATESKAARILVESSKSLPIPAFTFFAKDTCS